MRTSRTWPVLGGLVLLLAGALWLEVSSQAAGLSPEVVIIGDTKGDDEQGEATRWYRQDAIDENHERARQLALRGDSDEALHLLAELRQSHPDNATLWAESGHWARRAGDEHLALELLARAAQLSSNIPTIDLDRALALEGLGKIDEAVAAYQAALRARPQHSPTRLLFARLLTGSHEFGKAIEVLLPAAQAGSNQERAKGLVALGRVRILNGEAETGRRNLTEAIERAPSVAAIWQGTADALLDSSIGADHETAANYAQTAISLAPDDPGARSLLGRIFERQGKAIEALDAYRECLRLDAHYDFARKRALRIALDAEDFPDARRHASVLLSQRPEERDSHFLAGLVESRAGDDDAARQHYQEAIKVSGGNYPEAYYNLGLLESGIKNHEAAIAAYQRALELRPEYATAWNNLGVVFSKSGNSPRALAAFERALEIEPSLSSAWRNLAKHLAHQGDHQKAVSAYRNAILHGAKDRSTRLNLGVELRKSGETRAATRLYEELLAQYPRYVQGWYNLAIARSALGDERGAEVAYRKALDVDPRHRRSTKNLGLMLARQNRTKEALQLLQEAVAMQPKDDESRLMLARLYFKMGDSSGCAREARRVTGSESDSREAADVLRQCARNL